MAKAPKEPHGSFEDTSFGIGQNTDGSFNIFPKSELPERLAQIESEEEATSHAIEESEGGDDISDLDDLDELLAPVGE